LRRRRGAAAAFAVVALAPLAAPRDAAARDPERAARLFAEGRAALASHDYALACSRFAESETEDPHEGTLINLAQCEEALGKLAAARQYWEQAFDLARALADPRADYDAHELARIDGRVPRLTIRLAGDAPVDTVVARDGVDFGGGSFGIALPLEPGRHVVVSRAPGRRPNEIVLELAEGERREIVVAPGPPVGPGAGEGTAGVPSAAGVPTEPPAGVTSPRGQAPAPSTPPPPAAPPGPGPLRTAAWVAAGLGVVGLGVGAVFGVRAFDAAGAAAGHCNGDYCDSTGASARRDEGGASTVATIGLASGAGFLLAGAALRVLSPSPSEARYVRRRLEYLSIGAGAVGLAVGALFGVRAITSARDADAGCVGDVCNHQGAAARRDEISAGDASTVAFVTGGVLAAAGVVGWLTEPRHTERAALRVEVTPNAAPGGAGLSARVAF
jgi:hypothetical protein